MGNEEFFFLSIIVILMMCDIHGSEFEHRIFYLFILKNKFLVVRVLDKKNNVVLIIIFFLWWLRFKSRTLHILLCIISLSTKLSSRGRTNNYHTKLCYYQKNNVAVTIILQNYVITIELTPSV